RFARLLRDAEITAVADVRSHPFSRFNPWFAARQLRGELERIGIAYMPMGDALGGRPRDPALCRDGGAVHDARARTAASRAGIEHIDEARKGFRVSLRCAEREPLDCHRCLLVAPELAARGLRIGHILPDGSIVPHETIEQRLLAAAADDDLFIQD